VCGAYIWGLDSPAYNVVTIDLFETLESDITYFQSPGASVYIEYIILNSNPL